MNLELKIIISLIFFCVNSNSAFCLEREIDFKNDTIVFLRGYIDNKYYEIENIHKAISDQSVSINVELSYPHMFFARLSSENEILFRNDFYFINGNANNVIIDSLKQINIRNSKEHYEFENLFKPFIINDQDKNFSEIIYNDRRFFDTKLLEYIENNNNSFVALWFVILRFHEEGHSPLFESMVNKFSKKVKISNLWKTLNHDLSKIQIKENYKFPQFELKNSFLITEKLNLPSFKYTYVDFWWSRCKPCLEKIPYIKDLYYKYHEKGFNVISISTDKETDIEKYWLKRIKEYNIPWKQYLDVNGEIAKYNKISSFPTNYILDSNGIIIAKNISIDDLKILLLKLSKQ